MGGVENFIEIKNEKIYLRPPAVFGLWRSLASGGLWPPAVLVTTGYNNVACWGCSVFDFSVIFFLLLSGVEKEAQSQRGLGTKGVQ